MLVLPSLSTTPMPHRLSKESLRIMKEARLDSGHALLRPALDLQMLLAFLERFDRLGWFPPIDLEKRRVLAANEVTMHVVREDLCFYEFCSKGARGERSPWLTIFFHVDARSNVRICGVEPTPLVNRQRSGVLDRIRMRVEKIDRALKRRKE
jgi:hypothetical protein